MSRVGYSEDESFPGQFELWQANCERSAKGKAGQAALRELEAALLALPSKRLIAEELEHEGDVCAIGALVRHKGITPKADPEFEMEEIGVECGMPRMLAWKVVALNDIELSPSFHFGRTAPITPEDRYVAVLEWVQKKLEVARS